MLEWNVHPGPEKVIVLIPAFPFSHEMWHPLVEKLKNDFTILTLDFPGFGLLHQSVPAGWTFPMVSEEIKRKLEALKMKQVTLCGISMGGYAALDFVTRFPQSVEGLVLANTQALADSDEAIENRNKTIRKICSGSLDDFAEEFLGKIFTEDRRKKYLQEIDFLKKLILAQAPSAIINALIAMCARSDSTGELAQINVPTLIVTGTEDFLITEARSAEMHAAIKGSRLEILRDVGHLSVVEEPAQWSRLLSEFVKGLSKHNQGEVYASKLTD